MILEFLVSVACSSGQGVLTAEDALVVLPGEFSRIVSVGDVDGGGWPDLVVARGLEDRPERIDVITLDSGATLRTLWAAGAPPFGDVAWDAGGDTNGDGVPDVVLGFPQAVRVRHRSVRSHA